ncbi:hypothetical protein [Paenibacillus ehimensis]|nr:hypothetical protein [Paenibacillus ehimensis]
MEGVFSYFFAIGAGFAGGVAAVFFPSMLLFRRMNKKGAKRDDY